MVVINFNPFYGAGGRDLYTAVVEATVSRFHPICMTTITTILGVIPLIISHDPVFYSMAIISGSQCLTLGRVIGTSTRNGAGHIDTA